MALPAISRDYPTPAAFGSMQREVAGGEPQKTSGEVAPQAKAANEKANKGTEKGGEASVTCRPSDATPDSSRWALYYPY